MNERFETDWLSLRERADAAARSRELTGRARRWLARRTAPHRIVDLGAGSGNNAAWLAPRLPAPQRWLLVDHDAELLARAASRLGHGPDRPAGVDTLHVDLAALDAAIPDGTDLATASALFDLASAAWIDSLAERCASVGCAALCALTVDGSWRFVDADGHPAEQAADAEMHARWVAHQRRDKGMGEALGGAATEALAAAFERHGYRVRRAPTPWRLQASGLAVELLAGWRRALLEQAPEASDRIERWHAERLGSIERGRVGIEVGHIDLWAEPPA